jgi:hypothetical protein
MGPTVYALLGAALGITGNWQRRGERLLALQPLARRRHLRPAGHPVAQELRYRATPASGPHRASSAVSTIVIASYSTSETSTDSATIVHTPP